MRRSSTGDSVSPNMKNPRMATTIVPDALPIALPIPIAMNLYDENTIVSDIPPKAPEISSAFQCERTMSISCVDEKASNGSSVIKNDTLR